MESIINYFFMQKNILTRGVERIIDRKHFSDALRGSKKLRIKHGIDPTGDKIHLGRAIQLWKLRDFQELGHKIVLIIGDFTARIGDPSDKPEGRKGLTSEQIEKNLKGYLEQFSKIIDIKKAEIRYNSEWFSKLDLGDFLKLAGNFSIQQLIHRRNFKQRWNNKEPITLQEVCYPLLQGYDSAMVKADVELGGSDQLFNLKMGRVIQRLFKQKPQDVITLKMLFGLDGRKMSTSWGNVVNISDEPKEMFGKLMSMKDEMIYNYFELCTRINPEELAKIKQELEERITNPKELKEKMAQEIVTLYHGIKQAEKAKKEFEKVFKNKGKPSKIRTLFAPKDEYPLVELLASIHFASSKGEAKRLVEQGGVKINDKKIKDYKEEIVVTEGMIIQVGKRKFAKLTKKDGRKE
jgi:tyrosyl-tRNA synthetase